MDTFELLSLGRIFFPRLVAALVLVATICAPKFSTGLIMRAAEGRGQQITRALERALRSNLDRPPRHRHPH